MEVMFRALDIIFAVLQYTQLLIGISLVLALFVVAFIFHHRPVVVDLIMLLLLVAGVVLVIMATTSQG
jgi:hypothetical protein